MLQGFVSGGGGGGGGGGLQVNLMTARNLKTKTLNTVLFNALLYIPVYRVLQQ